MSYYRNKVTLLTCLFHLHPPHILVTYIFLIIDSFITLDVLSVFTLTKGCLNFCAVVTGNGKILKRHFNE